MASRRRMCLTLRLTVIRLKVPSGAPPPHPTRHRKRHRNIYGTSARSFPASPAAPSRFSWLNLMFHEPPLRRIEPLAARGDGTCSSRSVSQRTTREFLKKTDYSVSPVSFVFLVQVCFPLLCLFLCGEYGITSIMLPRLPPACRITRGGPSAVRNKQTAQFRRRPK